MYFQGVGDHNAQLTQKFKFLAQNSAGTALDVVLEYVAPDTLNNERQQEQQRIIGQRKYNALHDLEKEYMELTRAHCQLLAARVKRIEGMTVRKLSQLVALDVPKLRSMGVKPTDEVYMDPADATPITEEERRKYGVPQQVQTRGQLAATNVLYLIQGNERFQNFVSQTIQDVSYFQNEDWWGEEQVKNSESGAGTSSAPQ